MFTAKSKTKAATKGRGAAAAKQLGLFVDFSCEDMISGGDDNGGDLEAELAEITGVRPVIKPNSKDKVPLPMDHIKQMAEECMKDVVENDDDDDFEKDEELLAELEEVVGNEEEGSSNLSSPTDTPVSIKQLTLSLPQSSTVSVNTGGLQGTLEERIQIYMVAINNAKQTGENSKMRRYERGLKTLQAMLASVKKGEILEEVEIPPPVAIGKSSAPVLQPDGLNAESVEAENTEDRVAEMLQDAPANSNVTVLPVVSSMSESHNVLAESATVTQSDISDVSTATISDGSGCDESKTKALLFGRQKEYKLAALTAKQQGNITTALEYVKMSKKFDIAIKALQNGEPVDLNNLPLALTGTSTQDKSPKPSSMVNLPDQQGEPKTELQVNIESGALPPPRDVLEALYQRMEKYKTAAAQAKANGNDRKARMHERIVKQYHDAIRAQKAGRKVDFGDLPIPPGFPTIPGVGRTSGYLGIAGTLQAASRLAAAEVEVKEDGDESGTPQSAAHSPVAKRSTKHADHMVQSQTAGPTLILPAVSEERQSLNPIKKPLPNDPLIQQSAIAQQQLELLQNRRKQYMKAALQAKQKENLEQAKHFIRTAKVFDPLILAVQNGKSIDISKVPSPPEDEDDNDFIIVHHKDVQISPNVDEVYTHLTNLLKEQYEKCMSYSKQFTHLGNVAETTKFEKMAVDCKKNLEILKLGQAQGLDPPKYHFEERTLKTVRIFSDLSSTEMLLIIVKGINLPAPSGVAAHDLDAFVKFEFQYPSTEQAQRNKTTVIKNTNCPEYNERFILNINRNHRGFKRIIQTKGIKFEIFHKGGFFRSDKPVGTAQLKLDKLETECEVREIVEIFDGRKSTGGRLELKVRMREPLNRQDMQTITEKWLILDLTTRSNHNTPHLSTVTEGIEFTKCECCF